tara:strand:+ start:63 stop:200 length:138 start_codon:yes stop_codon:yes gene_type:complete
MKFIHPQDTKAFLLGVIASLSAVLIWDLYTRKERKKFFNRENTNG